MGLGRLILMSRLDKAIDDFGGASEITTEDSSCLPIVYRNMQNGNLPVVLSMFDLDLDFSTSRPLDLSLSVLSSSNFGI